MTQTMKLSTGICHSWWRRLCWISSLRIVSKLARCVKTIFITLSNSIQKSDAKSLMWYYLPCAQFEIKVIVELFFCDSSSVNIFIEFLMAYRIENVVLYRCTVFLIASALKKRFGPKICTEYYL